MTYVADTGNHVIRRIQGGTVTTYAGTGKPAFGDAAEGQAAAFNRPLGLALDAEGNLFVADSGNHVIRRIAAEPPHRVTTLAGVAGQPGARDGRAQGDALFGNLKGLALQRNLLLAIHGNFDKADALRILLADGLSDGGRVDEGAGIKPMRRWFLCRAPNVGLVMRAPGTEEGTDYFKVVAWRSGEHDAWQVITAFPVAAP